jgi:hypothetical protein
MFAARSSMGRSIKIFLFGIGVVLPLGSLIWAAWVWHGRGIRKCSLGRHTRPQDSSVYPEQSGLSVADAATGLNPGD